MSLKNRLMSGSSELSRVEIVLICILTVNPDGIRVQGICKLTSFPRSTVAKSLGRLLRGGLARKINTKPNYYTLTSPKNVLFHFFKEIQKCYYYKSCLSELILQIDQDKSSNQFKHPFFLMSDFEQ